MLKPVELKVYPVNCHAFRILWCVLCNVCKGVVVFIRYLYVIYKFNFFGNEIALGHAHLLCFRLCRCFLNCRWTWWSFHQAIPQTGTWWQTWSTMYPVYIAHQSSVATGTARVFF